MFMRATVLGVAVGVASSLGLQAAPSLVQMDMYAFFHSPDGAYAMKDLSMFKLRDLSSIVSEVHQSFDEGETFDSYWLKRIPVTTVSPQKMPSAVVSACDQGEPLSSTVGVFELTTNDTTGNRNWQSTPYPGFGSWLMPAGVCPNSQVVAVETANFVCPPGVSKPTGTEDCLVAVDLTVPAVDLATIMGINQEKCFTHLKLKLRNCTSIKDFTENCATNSYRREFAGVNPAQAYTCSLHSLTPSCRQSCSDAACLRTPRDQVEWTFKHREIGLPFWQRRCEPWANRNRVEAFAEATGVQGAARDHRVVPWSVQSQTCASEPKCGSPDASTGGFYCTRIYSASCTQCYIPGTVAPIFAAERETSTWPVCPYDILDMDFTGVKPECASTDAKDGCCLYTDTCEGDVTPGEAALDSSGLALVASRRNDADLAVYLQRLCTTIPDESKVPAFAHKIWNIYPLGLDFDVVKQDFQGQLCYFGWERAFTKFFLRLFVASWGIFGFILGLGLCLFCRRRPQVESKTPKVGLARSESEMVQLA